MVVVAVVTAANKGGRANGKKKLQGRMSEWDGICVLGRQAVMLRGSPAHFKQGQSPAVRAPGNPYGRI